MREVDYRVEGEPESTCEHWMYKTRMVMSSFDRIITYSNDDMNVVK
jgi:hypothetical protein